MNQFSKQKPNLITEQLEANTPTVQVPEVLNQAPQIVTPTLDDVADVTPLAPTAQPLSLIHI